MKKSLIRVILLCFVLIVAELNVQAQKETVPQKETTPKKEPTVQKGAQMLSYNLGYGWSWGGDRIGFIPAILAYEAGLWKIGPGTVTLGGMFMFSVKRYYINLYFAAKGAYHYNFNIPKFDAFAGVTIGPKIPIYTYSFTRRGIDWVGVNTFFGASYYFNQHIGVTTQFAIGTVNWYLIGMSFKLK